MNNVIVFGSLNADLSIACDVLPREGETIMGHDFLLNTGGKGGNQAVAAAKSGAKTYMIAKVGNDTFGNSLINSLEEYGVLTDFVTKSKTHSSGVAVIVRFKNDNRIIVDNGSNLEMNSNDVLEILDKIAKPKDFYISQFECNEVTTIESIKNAKSKGLITVFNPAPAKEIPQNAYKDIDLLIVNQSECEFLCGIYPSDENTCKEAAIKFKNLGVNKIIITLSSKGSFALIDDEVILKNACKINPVDTTGAGDTFIGALVSRLALGEGYKESMEFASKASAITCLNYGAMQAIPKYEEIINFKGE